MTCVSFVLLLLRNELPGCAWLYGDAYIVRNWGFWPAASKDLRCASGHLRELGSASSVSCQHLQVGLEADLPPAEHGDDWGSDRHLICSQGQILSQRHPVKWTQRYCNIEIFPILSCWVWVIICYTPTERGYCHYKCRKMWKWLWKQAVKEGWEDFEEYLKASLNCLEHTVSGNLVEWGGGESCVVAESLATLSPSIRRK